MSLAVFCEHSDGCDSFRALVFGSDSDRITLLYF